MMKLNNIKLSLYSITLVFAIAISSYGQYIAGVGAAELNAASKNVVLTQKFKSVKLEREMSYRLILPKNYSSAKKERFAVLYLLHGLTGSYKDWADRSKLAEYNNANNLIIVMPDANNSWYVNSPVVEKDKYESYIIDELIPKIDKELRTIPERKGRMIAGLSMGGYGAVKFGLKYPDKFILSGSFSGALRAAEWQGKDLGGWKVLAESVDRSFGKAGSTTRKDNDIFKLLESKSREELAKLPYFYVDCGTEDILIKQNREFAVLLFEQKVPHEFRQLPGRHDWQFWDSQIQEFLRLSKNIVNK